MKSIFNLLLSAVVIYSAGYKTRGFFEKTRFITLKKVKRGLSSSEKFAQRLTGKKFYFNSNKREPK